MSRDRRRSALLPVSACAALVLALLGMPSAGQAETTSPAPVATDAASATTDAASTAAGTTTATATPGSGSSSEPTVEPTASATATATAKATPVRAASVSQLTLNVAPAGSPQPNTYFQDIGAFGISGHASDADGLVEIWRYGGGSWSRLGSAPPDDAGDYEASYPVTDVGTYRFQTTSGGAPADAAVVSNEVSVTVIQSSIALDTPVATIDSLKNPVISGHIVPARAAVVIHIDVLLSGHFRYQASAVTDGTGRFARSLAYGNGSLATYTIRATYHATNRDRWEISPSKQFRRIAVLNPVATPTTSADVAKTYHSGCPVGPSKLRTIRMNFYGRDAKMHRGVLIVRSDLTTEVNRGFATALAHRYPVAKMNNPNVYGGNDPVQMKANNSSGFNCRKVVGNPYRMSPHSYGIAIDVNTVQNPYRDRNGKWWPENGKPYIKRSPRRPGMLFSDSYLTKSLRGDDFFWGGFWNPGRDYQHFQYNP
jgi:D-alanyl-D-alanine carboxypeptidase-like protein